MQKITYRDFEIHVRKDDSGKYPVEVTFDGQREYEGYLAGDRPDTGDAGVDLFKWIFTDEGPAAAWSVAREYPLRIRLRIDKAAPELHAERWELLREKDGPVIPAATDTPFSRYIQGSWMPGTPVLTRPIQVLVAVADTADVPELHADVEYRELQSAIGSNPFVHLTLLKGACTLAALETELRKGEYHVLHFIGHGGWPQYPDGEAYLYLAKDASNQQREDVSDTRIAEMFERVLGSARSDEKRLRLVYLSSCETALRDPFDAFRGLAPKLIAAGVPSVLAMQEAVKTTTAVQFAASFYEQLMKHGLIDLAANEARSTLLTKEDRGAGIPALFMRVRSGELFGKKGTITGDFSDSDWTTLVERIRRGFCTPILGPGVPSKLLPSSEELARALADKKHYPFSDSDDLRRVTQFCAIGNADGIRLDVLEEYTRSINRLLMAAGFEAVDDLASLTSEHWKAVSLLFETEIHNQLAALGLPLYLTTNFDPFMRLALDAKLGEGKSKTAAISWRVPPVETPSFAFTKAEPLVLHLFGNDPDPSSPNTMVLTEDEHLTYLTQLIRDHEHLVPASIDAKLNQNTLLLLGYRLRDLDVKVILRGLLACLHKEANAPLQIAVQIGTDDVVEADRIKITRYLTESLKPYLGSSSPLCIYWGTAQQFMAELTMHRQAVSG